MRSLKLNLLAVAVLVFTVTFQVSSASAQAGGGAPGAVVASDGDSIKGNIAGTVGLGLLGAELGLVLTPTFGLQNHWWAWVLLPTVGAAGGAVAGALAFDPRSPGPEVTVTLLGVGLALVIPAVVGALAIKDRRNNRAMENRLQGGGAIRLSKRGTKVGLPDMGVAPVYSHAEQQRYGVSQRNAFQVSLLSGRF